MAGNTCYRLEQIYARSGVATAYSGWRNMVYAPIPEPGTWALLALGLAAVMARSQRRPNNW